MRPIAWAAAFSLLAGLACASGTESAAPGTAPAGDGTCAEHGVLEAVCTKCDPSLIPVFRAKGDWCPEHGFPMSFCPIHHPELGGRPPVDRSPADGPADGTRIRFETRDTAREAGIEVVAARLAADEGGVEAVAHLTWDATLQAVVGARGPGIVLAVRADVGTVVRAGDALAIVQSATAAADRSGAAAARTRAQVAEQALERKRALEGVVSDAEVALAEQELAAARAAVTSLEVAAGYTATAPIAGVVTRRDVTVGAGVDVGSPMFEIVDPSRLWAELDVPEAEVRSVQLGQTVSLELDGFDEPLAGAVAYVSPSIDPDTRTALVRVPLDNADGQLRANLYGTARIAVGGAREVVVVPTAAVQHAKTVDVVFVRLGVDLFETRRVRVVRRRGEQTWLTGGVRTGEEVVGQGSFLLKTELLKDGIGAGCCDAD